MTSERDHRWASPRIVVRCVLLFVVLHAAFLVLVRNHMRGASAEVVDCNQYSEIAASLGRGDGLSRRVGHIVVPEVLRTPLYPLFLWTIGGSLDAMGRVAGAQHLLLLFTGAIVAALTRRAGGGIAAQVIGFLLVACDLTSMTYASYLLTETLFTSLLWAAVLSWVVARSDNRPALGALAGALWGAATLCRPISLYMGAAWVLLQVARLMRRRASVRLIAAAIIAAVLTLTPWVARNFRLTGAPVLSVIEGEYALYYRAVALGKPPEMTLDNRVSEVRRELGEARYDVTNPKDLVALDRARRQKALDLLRAHPGDLLKLWGIGIPRLLLGPNRTFLYRLMGVQHQAWDLNDIGTTSGHLARVQSGEAPYLIGSLGYQVALLLLAIAGAVYLAAHGAATAVTIGGVLIYLVALSSGLEAHARFRVPVVPGLAVLAAVALEWAWQWAVERQRSPHAQTAVSQ